MIRKHKKFAYGILTTIIISISYLNWNVPPKTVVLNDSSSLPHTSESFIPTTGSQARSESRKVGAIQSDQLDAFSRKVEEALASMKGHGTQITQHKNPPTKRIIRLAEGLELVELTFEHGGKTYLPKGEDAGIGVWASSTHQK